MSNNNGGPAFPSEGDIFYSNDNNSEIKTVPVKYTGMTLRDFFAAKAMQALLPDSDFDHTAREAYDMADAMLRVRGEE